MAAAPTRNNTRRARLRRRLQLLFFNPPLWSQSTTLCDFFFFSPVLFLFIVPAVIEGQLSADRVSFSFFSLENLPLDELRISWLRR